MLWCVTVGLCRVCLVFCELRVRLVCYCDGLACCLVLYCGGLAVV